MTDEQRVNKGGRRNGDITLAEIGRDVKHILDRMDGFVTKAEFKPVQAVAYGLVGLLMSAVLVLIVASALG